jgi:hypothetical protein
MLLLKRLFNLTIVLMVVSSFITVIPFDERPGFFGKATADFVGFTADARVNDDPNIAEQSNVAMAVYNNNIYLVWHDMRNSDFDIYFSKSTNGGTTWGDGLDNNNDIRVDDTDRNLNNSDNESMQKYPDIAVDGSGNIYVVWQDDRGGRGDSDIYFSKSIDGGATFIDNVRVDHNGTGKFDQLNPCIALDTSNNIFIAWEDERNGITDFDIYFTKSSDGGTSFVSPDVNVDDDTGLRLQKNPRIAVTTSGTKELYLTWQDERKEIGNYDIFFSKSSDDGASWGDGSDNNNDKRINDNLVSSQENPDIALDSAGNIVVVWDDERDEVSRDVYISRSADSGTSWSSNKRLVDAATNTADQSNPVIATNGKYFSIAWLDNRDGQTQTDIYFAYSSNEGYDFGPFLKVDQGPSDTIQSAPSIVVNGADTVFLAWDDNRDALKGRDIYFAKSGKVILQAPTLTDDKFTPDKGANSTQFHFTVVYTDIENDAPATNHPLIHMFKDGAGTEALPGSPYVMNRQMMPAQDGHYSNGEIFEKYIYLTEEYNYTYYIEAKALYGNTTMVKTNLTKGPILDKSNVTFSNAFPQGNVWNNKARVKCGITITDIGFAGVDLLTVSYSISTNGTENFGKWKNPDLDNVDWEYVQNGIKIALEIFFEDGVNNFIKWSAKDKFGNGPNESAFYQVKIDSTPVTFSDSIPDPSENLWFNNETVEVSINVNDIGGIGVNASSIEYSYSTTGPEGFGAWINAGAATDGEKVNAKASVTFANGTMNYLRWRASDILGNGPEVSEDIRLRIDTTLANPVTNTPPTPPENVKPETSTDRTPYITWVPGTDPDGDELTYWIQIGTSVNGSEILAWTGVGTKLFYSLTKSLSMGIFYIHLKSYDGFDFSPVLITQLEITKEGNTPPEPPTEISPRFTSERRPIIGWKGAFDAEDDPLTYYIQIGSGSGSEDILILTYNGYQSYYEYLDSPLQDGIYYVTILVYDSKDWSEPGEFVLKVADYQLGISTDSSVSIPQGESKTLVLTVDNLGSSEDTVTLNYSNVLSNNANISFAMNGFILNPLSNTTIDLKIAILPSAVMADYYLKITAISEDGLTVTEHTVIVTITESTIGPPPNGDNGNGKDDEETESLGNLLRGSFFWLILIIIIIVVAVIVYLGARSRRREGPEKEAIREKEYDDLYAGEGEYPPQPPPAAETYDYYGEGAPPPPPDGAWPPEGAPPQMPEQQYYDDYGVPQTPPPYPEQYPADYMQEQGAVVTPPPPPPQLQIEPSTAYPEQATPPPPPPPEAPAETVEDLKDAPQQEDVPSPSGEAERKVKGPKSK